MGDPLFTERPSVLWQRGRWAEFAPLPRYTPAERLNCLVRLTVIVTVVLAIVLRSWNPLIVGAAIVLLLGVVLCLRRNYRCNNNVTENKDIEDIQPNTTRNGQGEDMQEIPTYNRVELETNDKPVAADAESETVEDLTYPLPPIPLLQGLSNATTLPMGAYEPPAENHEEFATGSHRINQRQDLQARDKYINNMLKYSTTFYKSGDQVNYLGYSGFEEVYLGLRHQEATSDCQPTYVFYE